MDTVSKFKLIAATALVSLTLNLTNVLAEGGDDSRALLDLLVKKGLLTNQEAADVAAKIRKDVADNSGYKIKTGSWMKELKFYGDARLRYEMRSGQNSVFRSPTAVNPSSGAVSTTTFGDSLTRERFRYRLRIGATALFTDNFGGGLQLETSTNPRSTNVTFGDEASGNSTSPFGKASDLVQVGKIYLDWSPTDWVTLTGGRMGNPLMTSLMVWDGDICPEGSAEKFKYKYNDNLELFSTLGQFFYDDKNPDEPLFSGTAGVGGEDAWLFAQQFGAKYSFNKDTSLTLAPVFYVYAGPGDSFTARFDGTAQTAGAVNDLAINDLLVVEIPFEFKWLMMNQKLKLFGDVAVNARGSDRADHAGRPDMQDQDMAYQAGLQWGEARTKGEWEAQVYWMHKELYALDPNLTDSDMFDSKLNLEGVVLGVKYNFTDFLSGAITYAFADRIEESLPTTFTGDIGINPLNEYQILQLDLSCKF
jgi:hypothetical protein